MRLAALFTIAAASLASCASPGSGNGEDDERACTLAGCGSALLEVQYPSSTDLSTSHVRACRNEECFEATFNGFGQTTYPVDATRRFELSYDPVQFYVSAAFTFADGTVGDIYSVTLTDMTGVTIATDRKRATSYTINQPNGPNCEPTCAQPTLVDE